MSRSHHRLIAAAGALLAACSMDPNATPPPPAVAGLGAAPTSLLAQAALAGITASAVAPQFGGKVGITGPTVVEVMPRTDGLVLAELRDASGALVTTGTVSVQLSAADGQPRTVPLRYDTDLQVFEGSAGVELPPAPSNVVVTVQAVGAPPSVVTLTQVPVAPVPAYGGQVVLVGPIAPEVRVDSDGSVHAYLPEASARLPSGKLYVNVGVGEAAPQRVELQYVEAQQHYVAQLGPTARPAGGALSVEYEAQGQPIEQGRTAHAVIVPASRLDGTIVVAGDYGFEVAPVDGELHATIADSSGVYVSAPPPSVNVYVSSQPAPVVMRWDTTRRIYVAPLPPAVNFETEPFRVEVRHNGRRHRGAVRMHARGRGPRARVVAAAPAGPTVTVVRNEPPPSRVEVRVQAPPPPRVQVRVEAPPPPRVQVRVEAPRPPGVQVRVQGPRPPSGSVRIQAGGMRGRGDDNGRHRGHR
jgi:hypothetical protein